MRLHCLRICDAFLHFTSFLFRCIQTLDVMTNNASSPYPFFSWFGIDAARARRTLETALSRGGDFADLYFERRSSQSFYLDDGRLEDIQRSIVAGVGIRVLKGEATGLAYTEDLSPEGLQRAAQTAANVASGVPRKEGVEVQGQRALDLYPVQRPSLDASAQEKIALLRAAEKAALAYDPRIKRVSASFAESHKDILIVASDGRYVADHQPMIRFNVSVVARDGERRQSGVEGGGGRYGMEYFDDHPPTYFGAEAARIAITMLDAREAPAGQMPVVLGKGDAGVLLHEAVGHGLEADFNRKKTSNYSGQMGKSVASSLCTIVDDGTIAASRGSINVDDEGFEPQRNVLIEDGILRAYMQDRISSTYYGGQPSGNGRRQDYRHVPLPRMTNTYMLPGKSTEEEIIASVKNGIYARSFSGGQVNISNGDFVFSVTEGYLIEDGKITAPVKDVNLIGNGPDVLRRVSMVGDDFALSDGRWTCGKDGQSVPVGVGMPTIRIDAMTVGGSGTS